MPMISEMRCYNFFPLICAIVQFRLVRACNEEQVFLFSWSCGKNQSWGTPSVGIICQSTPLSFTVASIALPIMFSCVYVT